MNYLILLWLSAVPLIFVGACVSDDPAINASATSATIPTSVASPNPVAMVSAKPTTDSAAAASPPANFVEPTRWAASLDGVLTEENGCLRVTSVYGTESIDQTIVWQRGIFEVERRGDALQIVDLIGRSGQPSPPVTWRLGEMIRGGGGVIDLPDDHAGIGFSERCPGPYFLVSMVR